MRVQCLAAWFFVFLCSGCGNNDTDSTEKEATGICVRWWKYASPPHYCRQEQTEAECDERNQGKDPSIETHTWQAVETCRDAGYSVKCDNNYWYTPTEEANVSPTSTHKCKKSAPDPDPGGGPTACEQCRKTCAGQGSWCQCDKECGY